MKNKLWAMLLLLIFGVTINIPSSALADNLPTPIAISSNNTFRTTNIITLNDGRLATALEGNDTYLTYSSDNGLNWTTPTMIIQHGTNWNPADISLLYANDILFCKYLKWIAAYTDAKIYIIKSLDSGRTWQAPQFIDTGYSYNCSPMGGIQMQNGTLIWGFSVYQNSGFVNGVGFITGFKVGFLLSKDNGNTWTQSQLIALPIQEGLDEPSVVELSNGSLYTLMRTNTGYLYYATSSDNGLTWTEAKASSLISPSAPASLYRVSFNPNKILASWDYNYSGRYPLVIAESVDDCRTWSQPVTIPTLNGNDNSYSQIITLNSNVLIFWWQHLNGISSIKGAQFPYDYIYNGTHASLPVRYFPVPNQNNSNSSGSQSNSDSGGGGGGGGGEMLGIYSLMGSINNDGRITENITALSGDKKVSLLLPKGTYAKNSMNQTMWSLRISPMPNKPPSTFDTILIGNAYDFQPAGGKFSQLVTLAIKYDKSDVPISDLIPSSVKIAQWDTIAQKWIRLDSQSDNGTITTSITHLSIYALIGQSMKSVTSSTTNQPHCQRFADDYAMSYQSAYDTIQRFIANPNSGEWDSLDSQTKSVMLNLLGNYP